MAEDGYDTKVACFQAATGLDDPELCAEILAAHNWDLELAVSAFTASSSVNPSSQLPRPRPPTALPVTEAATPDFTASPGIAWRLITLPFYVVSGGVGLVTGLIRLGCWITGGVLYHSLRFTGLLPAPSAASTNGLVPVSTSTMEAANFVESFTREFGSTRNAQPRFSAEGFMDALQRSQREYKLLFVYLHSPDHPDVPEFCSSCLCSVPLVAFLNENFVVWGGSIRQMEGFKMSNSLNASRFPFCAVVMASPPGQRIVLLQQIEGPTSPEVMITILQRVVEECTPMLVSMRLEAEERQHNQRLREEQDAAYRAALEVDQARERQQREHQERLEREAAELERKHLEEEELLARTAREAAEREAARARKRQEKAMSLDVEPPKGPDVTQVLIRFPNGQRKERRFYSSSTISSLYDYVDSLDCLNDEKYSLVSIFPRIIFGLDKHSLTLKDAGLHPQASLFIEF